MLFGWSKKNYLKSLREKSLAKPKNVICLALQKIPEQIARENHWLLFSWSTREVCLHDACHVTGSLKRFDRKCVNT